MSDVVVVGNIGIDTNVYFPNGGSFESGVESSFTEDLDCIGQAGGYTARGFAKLGWSTEFIGHVGDDFSGEYIRNELARDGIGTKGVFVDPAGTSRSVNMMYADGRRKNFYDGKSHMTLMPDLGVCRDVAAGCRLAHFHLANWARKVLPLVKSDQTVISCDIQDVVEVGDAYRDDFVRGCDILFFSAANHDDPERLVQWYLDHSTARVVVSGMGASGCAVGTEDGVRLFDPVPYDAPVVDTNGAGDGLAVGFLSSYVLDGLPIERAVVRGQLTARHTCSLKANSSDLLTRVQLDELEARL